MCKQLERICWRLPTSGFNYGFVFQMIYEKHGTKNILLTIWEKFLCENICNYNCYKFSSKILIQFSLFCRYQIQKFYYIFFLLMLLFGHIIMLSLAMPYENIFFSYSAFIVGTWKCSTGLFFNFSVQSQNFTGGSNGFAWFTLIFAYGQKSASTKRAYVHLIWKII